MPTSNSTNESSNTSNVRSFSKPLDDAWITSGNIGSRDAVLVFRTNILKASGKQNSINCSSSTNDVIKSTSSKTISSDITKSLFHCDRSKSDYCIFGYNDVMTTSLPSTSETSKDDHVDDGIKDINSNNSIKTHVRKIHVSVKKSKSIQSNPELSKKHLKDSLSSSDNSISSECDEPFDAEYTIIKSKPNLLQFNKGPVESTTTEGYLDVTYSADDMEESQASQEKDNENENDCDNDPFMPDMPASQLNITYKFVSTETKLVRKIFLRHGMSEVDSEENFNILWTGVHIKPDILRNLAPYQRVNHFPRSFELTRKDRLYKNIERMQHLRGFKHFDIVPQSFVLPLEYRNLVSAHNKHRGPWIVKPAASSRGRGIFIVKSPDQIPQDEQVLVSQYVADPLCIDGHKCDLRVYVLVTSFDPLIIYLYEEGLVRLATVKYDRNADNLWNPCMHLCNYSINKYHSDYIKANDAQDEDVGHKWTLSALLRHLKSQGCDTRQLMINIEDLIIKSILSCAQSIISACRMFVPSGSNCFELYGFDILIDDTLKPWMLEINLSPSMGVDSPLDTKVKSCLITDLLTCVGIPAYSPSMRSYYDSKWTRFRGVNYSRRTSSADPSGNIKRNGPVTAPLTLEEQRIIRNARLQNTRRGGFVRIFPTDDTLQKYGMFLDAATGIPISTSVTQGQVFYSMAVPHNYNIILYNNLYGKNSKDHGIKEENCIEERMNQYERALDTNTSILFTKKKVQPKCLVEGKRLCMQILKLIDNGSELTQLQARQTFALYLEAVLNRLTQEPKDYHENLILKFVNRVGGGIKGPVFFRSPQNIRTFSKARSAMVAKLLGDYLEQYNRDTEAYVDSFDHYGMIPSVLFNGFLSQAQEADLESVLALNTNLTGTMSYLYNRCGLSVPPTPPIPSGLHGFLKALPAMVVSGSGARDLNNYVKLNEKENCGTKKVVKTSRNRKSTTKR